MPLQPGLLRNRVTLQTLSSASDEGGGSTDTPVDGATVWASVEPLEGDEAMRGMALDATVSHRIRMRYRAGVTAAMRIKLGSRVFHIRQVINVDERNEQLEILASEAV